MKVKAHFVTSASKPSEFPSPGLPEIAIVGRSNVGKSSLLNAMMQRLGLARTSRTPGCTRQLNVFEVRCADGLAVRFVDLPGYGWARRSKSERHEWQGMIEGYLRRRAGLRAVVLLLDIRRGVEEEEKQLVEFLAEPREVSSTAKPLEIVLVATKVDKLGAAGKKPALDKVRQSARQAVGGTATTLGPVIGFSAVTGEGRDELWGRIRAAVL